MTRPTYGGQAVMEGVMIRGPEDMAIAVRDASGQIVLHTERLGGIYTSRWAKLPVIRGVVALWDSLGLGFRSLVFSAQVAAGGIDEDGHPREIMPKGMLWGTMAFGLFLAVGLFFVVPAALAAFLDQFTSSAFVSNLVEKVIRLGLILGYIAGIGMLPDIKRVYAYHGAEHKTINAYEAGAPLSVESVKRFGTAHPRCGTAFLLVVVLVSFVAFLLLGQPSLPIRLLSRVLLIPVIAGIAYELIKLAAANYHRRLARILISPGLAVQSLTTREPDDSQLEVAIRSLRGVLEAEEARRATPQARPTSSQYSPINQSTAPVS